MCFDGHPSFEHEAVVSWVSFHGTGWAGMDDSTAGEWKAVLSVKLFESSDNCWLIHVSVKPESFDVQTCSDVFLLFRLVIRLMRLREANHVAFDV